MKSILCLALCLPWLCVSCASPKPDNAQTVAVIPRNSDGSEFRTHGFLIVNTPTEMRWDEHSARRFTHTGYSIYSAYTGRLIQYIPNHAGQAGEFASTVLLPAGNYFVEARTALHRPIRFPVVIRPETQTTVNLGTDVPPPNTVQGGLYAIEDRGHTIGWICEARAD